MKIPSKPLAFMALSALLALILQMAVSGKAIPVHAQIGPGGNIVSISADREIYLPRTTVKINMEIQNDGSVTQDYQLGVSVVDPSGEEVYNSIIAGFNDKHSLFQNETKALSFSWETGDKTEAGDYIITAALRDWIEFDVIFDEVTSDDGSAAVRHPLN